MANERDRTLDGAEMDDETIGGAANRDDASREQMGGRSEENLRGTADDEDEDEFDETDDLDDEDDEQGDGTI
jgi:hypothetical protein